MKKILIFSILLSSCSLLHASTNINNINTNSINKIGENNTVNYYNKANYTISVDAFRITEKERDDFVKNYNKYPFLSSTNANLLFKSLSNKAYNNYNGILKEYVFFYFSEDEFGMQNIIDGIIELDSVKDDKSLIKALIWAVVDNYIRSLKKCNTDNLKTIIIDILGQFASNGIKNDYIETIINNQNKINELTRQLNFEIDKCNLYKVINSIIIGVNKIAKLHEKRVAIDNRNNKSNKKSPKKMQCIYTLSNGNAKCSLMSTWELIRTILIQSIGEEYYNKLKNTDFAKFDRYLCNLFYSNYNRKINKNKQNINYWNENYYDEHLEMYDLTWDRTGKSNVAGGRIDLISELILWDANNNKWNKTISNEDNIRRTKTLDLLKQAQDSNMKYNPTNAITIILNIFPELKKYIGNTLYNENDKRIGYSNKDVMSTQSERFANELDKYKNDPRYKEPYKPKKKHHNANKKPLESFLNKKILFLLKKI